MAQITEVRVRLVEDGDKLKAFAQVVLDGEYVIDGLRVLEGPKGEFVAMPSRRTDAGEYRDTFFPITREAREKLLDAVCQAYVEAGARAAQEQEEPEKKGRRKKAG